MRSYFNIYWLTNRSCDNRTASSSDRPHYHASTPRLGVQVHGSQSPLPGDVGPEGEHVDRFDIRATTGRDSGVYEPGITGEGYALGNLYATEDGPAFLPSRDLLEMIEAAGGSAALLAQYRDPEAAVPAPLSPALTSA